MCAVALLGPGSAQGACPNEHLRTGLSAALPDCRAYELVTPPSSNGRLFYTLKSALSYSVFPTELVSPLRDSFVYMMLGGPLDQPPEANGTYDQYQAERTPTGWQTVRRLSPNGAQAVFPNAGGVSADHRYAFTEVGPVQEGRDGGSLAESGNAEYLGEPDGSFELVGIGSLGTERLAQGRFITPGGEHVIFNTGGDWCSLEGSVCELRRLEPDAPPTGTAAVYDRGPDGPTRVVSLLPGNVTPAAGAHAQYQGSSLDGSTIAFKIEGSLYVRVDNAYTLPVTAQPSTFAGISSNGSWLFYVSGGDIFAFDAESGATKQATASGDAEVVNVSADGSHVYFVSKSILDGAEGTVGQPNLYVWNRVAGTTDFIATVDPSDLEGSPALTNWTDSAVSPDKTSNQGPGADSSRTTPDGTVFVFESEAQLTAYENQGHNAIYLYDAGDQTLACVSCNPSAEAATADARLEEVNLVGPAVVIHNLSDDGTRVFFETPEALVADDVDGINDVYQWHRESELTAPVLDLISSGRSPAYVSTINGPIPTNIIFGIDPQGEDVVFSAYEQLVPSAGVDGVQALYDARVGGGFAEPSPPPACTGESCRSGPPLGSLSIGSPSSAQPRGNGNVVRKRRQRCRQRQQAKRRACRKRRQQGQRGAQSSRPIVVLRGMEGK